MTLCCLCYFLTDSTQKVNGRWVNFVPALNGFKMLPEKYGYKKNDSLKMRTHITNEKSSFETLMVLNQRNLKRLLEI